MARSNSRPRSPAAALAVVLVATIGCAARSHAAGRSEDVAERLRLAAPEVVWRDEQQLDLNGDALMDHVVLGRTQTEAVVGFVLGTMSEPPIVFRVPESSGAALGICTDPSAARLVIEGRAPGDDPDAPPAAKGPAGPGVQGVRLEAGDCDSVHFYFDGATVTWWRR